MKDQQEGIKIKVGMAEDTGEKGWRCMLVDMRGDPWKFSFP